MGWKHKKAIRSDWVIFLASALFTICNVYTTQCLHLCALSECAQCHPQQVYQQLSWIVVTMNCYSNLVFNVQSTANVLSWPNMLSATNVLPWPNGFDQITPKSLSHFAVHACWKRVGTEKKVNEQSGHKLESKFMAEGRTHTAILWLNDSAMCRSPVH